MATIDLDAAINMSEREILLLLVQQGQQTNDHLAKLNGSVGKHDQRIEALEKWRYLIMGGAAVVAYVAGKLF